METNHTTTPARFHHATMDPGCYYPGSESSADAVSRGLAIRTLGSIRDRESVGTTTLLLSIEGARSDAEEWASEFGALLAEPAEFSVGSCEFEHASAGEYARNRARGLVLRALDSFGPDSLALAASARALVGIDGIEDITTDLADENDVESAWTIRGALAALQGFPIPGLEGEYALEAREGYDFVVLGGYAGAWA